MERARVIRTYEDNVLLAFYELLEFGGADWMIERGFDQLLRRLARLIGLYS